MGMMGSCPRVLLKRHTPCIQMVENASRRPADTQKSPSETAEDQNGITFSLFFNALQAFRTSNPERG